MKCVCGSEDIRVVDSRSVEETNSIRRRRICEKCGRRFTTYETIEEVPVLVIKSDGTRQAFVGSKIKTGIIRACEKRPVSMSQIDKIVQNVENKVMLYTSSEIPSKTIGEYVMEELKALDEVAYVRFASVYKKFKDVDTFLSFLKNL